MTRTAGRLVALEGVDGSGKTTQARILAESLGAVLTFEPGATELGRALRRLVLDPAHPAPEVRTEALLLAADRSEHVSRIVRPALCAGRHVVTDRFSGSTLAYQGYGRGIPLDELRRLVSWATGGLEADLTVVVDIDPALARRRVAHEAKDRLERLDEDFFGRVRDGYLELAAADPERWAVVDGRDAVEAVAAGVRTTVEQRLGIPAPRGAAL